MAIDTAHRRFSMINFGSGMATDDLLFVPDGSVDLNDRALLQGLYSGVGSFAGGVDTAAKRLCMLNFPYTESVQLMAAPSGEVDAAARLQLLDMYCGLVVEQEDAGSPDAVQSVYIDLQGQDIDEQEALMLILAEV